MECQQTDYKLTTYKSANHGHTQLLLLFSNLIPTSSLLWIASICRLMHLAAVLTTYVHYYQILNDFTSSYKSRVLRLNLLPLMFTLELNKIKDLIFHLLSVHLNTSTSLIIILLLLLSVPPTSSQQKLIHHSFSTRSYFIRIVCL